MVRATSKHLFFPFFNLIQDEIKMKPSRSTPLQKNPKGGSVLENHQILTKSPLSFNSVGLYINMFALAIYPSLFIVGR
jgi:hypothetical protein